MTKDDKISKNKWLFRYKFILAIIIFLGLLSVGAFAATRNGEIMTKKTNSVDVINKLKNIQSKGGAFKITQQDIDELCNLYSKSPKKREMFF